MEIVIPILSSHATKRILERLNYINKNKRLDIQIKDILNSKECVEYNTVANKELKRKMYEFIYKNKKNKEILFNEEPSHYYYYRGSYFIFIGNVLITVLNDKT